MGCGGVCGVVGYCPLWYFEVSFLFGDGYVGVELLLEPLEGGGSDFLVFVHLVGFCSIVWMLFAVWWIILAL